MVRASTVRGRGYRMRGKNLGSGVNYVGLIPSSAICWLVLDELFKISKPQSCICKMGIIIVLDGPSHSYVRQG